MDKECYNCKKKGHLLKDCWAKGGGMEGKGPRGRKGPNRDKEERSNQAEEVNNSLNDVAYMAGGQTLDSKHFWYLDSGTTSHICNNREAYTKFIQTDPVPIRGIGSSVNSMGYRTIKIYFHIKGRTLSHELQNVLYIPNVPNCLISVS